MIIEKHQNINNKVQLVANMESYTKPKENWKIGVEYEKFAYSRSSKKPLAYEEIINIFSELQKLGWTTIQENGLITKLYNGISNISLEPGGQLELSSTPHENLHQVYNELFVYTEQLKNIGDVIGVSYLTLGFHPEWMLHEIPKMPNPNNRYDIISSYMKKISKYGIDMMFRTCSAQVSIDYSNEADMVKKYRVSLALQPILTAIFSNSPFIDGKPTDRLSARSFSWANANPKRTGMFPVVFQEEFGFEKYVDHTLDLPLYFIYRDGKYIDAKGQPFKDFLAGRLQILPGKLPTLQDWENHISTLWPEVRLKKVLEMRGADSGPISRICALSALLVGILYDQSALDFSWDLVRGWDAETRNRLRHEVIHKGLDTMISKKVTVKDVAKEIVDIAKRGLTARAKIHDFDADESIFLDDIYEIVISGKTPANVLLESYYGKWNELIDVSDLKAF